MSWEETIKSRTIQLSKALRELEISKESLMVALNKERELGELKSRFISIASHEFRMPLSIILSSVFLIKHYVSDQDIPLHDKHIQRVINNVKFLTDTLNRFLLVSKIEEGKIQVLNSEFDIEEQVNAVIREMRQDISKGKQVIVYNHTGDKTLVLDASLIKQIFVNLLGNAIKFCVPDSFIEIVTTGIGGVFTLTVKDNGIGISEEDQAHLFERFHRGNNAVNFPGIGLGLHIVQRYVAIMNGDIRCDSKLNQGIEFTVILPLGSRA